MPFRQIDVPFASQGDNSPIVPILVRLFLDLCRERDSTHDPISKFLIQYSLVRIPVVLYNFIEAVDQRLLGRHVHGVATKRVACQLIAELAFVHTQHVGELFNIFGCRLGLAVEDCCDSYFVAAKLLRYVFKCEVLGCFRFEQSRGLNREAVAEGGL